MCDVLAACPGYWISKVWEYVIINNMPSTICTKNIQMHSMVECKVYNKIVLSHSHKTIAPWNVTTMAQWHNLFTTCLNKCSVRKTELIRAEYQSHGLSPSQKWWTPTHTMLYTIHNPCCFVGFLLSISSSQTTSDVTPEFHFDWGLHFSSLTVGLSPGFLHL